MNRSNQSTFNFRRQQLVENWTQIRLSKEFKFILLLSAVHLPLGILFFRIGSVSLLHPLGVFLLGVYWALQQNVRLERITLVCAYIIGAEVLWRMADVPVNWEFGKYSVCVIMVLALVRRGLFSIPFLPAAYLLLLIPACLLVIANYYPEFAQISISFNMSGPLLLSISCWFFHKTRFRQPEIKRVIVMALIPLLSVAFTTLFLTLANPNIEFTLESNDATSGGFGPNQVSSMLGLGAFLAVGMIMLFRNSSKEKIFYGFAATFLAAQSVMTFSRGGIYSAAGAILVLFIFQVKDPQTFIKKAIPVIVLALLFAFWIFPLLDQYTGGMLEQRFESTETTHRVDIIQSDFQMLAENPVFGVGVGVARGYREKFVDFSSASHTEFSRLIAEHGIFGIAAIFSLLLMIVLNLKRQRPGFGRALAAGLITWSSLFMFNAGMRLAAPSFLWGVSFAAIAGVQILSRRKSKSLIRKKHRSMKPQTV